MDGRNGGTVSLDQLTADGYDIPAVDDVADAVMYAILLDRLYEELDKLCPTDRLIMHLFSLGMSEREISAALKQRAAMDPAIKALSQKSVNLHKLSLFDLLRERLKDYR